MSARPVRPFVPACFGRNPHPLSDAVRARNADVTQDDEWFAPLTVRETMLFAARLKLPVTLSLEQREARVDEVIADLDLTEVTACDSR